MRYWVLFVALILAACAPHPQPLPAPLPTAEMVAAPMPLYFPIAVKSAPLVADQRAGPEVCMAWSGQYLSEARRDFGAQLYYHSATWRVPSVTAVPIVRARPGQREGIADMVILLPCALTNPTTAATWFALRSMPWPNAACCPNFPLVLNVNWPH